MMSSSCYNHMFCAKHGTRLVMLGVLVAMHGRRDGIESGTYTHSKRPAEIREGDPGTGIS